MGRAAAAHTAADHRQENQVLRDRRLQGRPGDRHGRARQHDHADLLLRNLRRPPPRCGDRGDQDLDQEDIREERGPDRPAELRRRRSDAREPL